MSTDVAQMKKRCLALIGLVTIMIIAYAKIDWTSNTNAVSNPTAREEVSSEKVKSSNTHIKSDLKPSSSLVSQLNVLPDVRSGRRLTGESAPKTILSYSMKVSNSSTARNSTRKLFNKISNITVPEINCDKLAWGDYWETRKAEKHQKQHSKVVMKTEDFLKSVSNCPRFVLERGYLTRPVSKAEEEFPLAFSMLIFRDIEQFEILLRAIYRPQNYYCIHVDSKSNPVFRSAAKALAGCFENVFLSPRSYDVQWGQFSIVEPELECMRELIKYKKWKYFINLTGQEFPLKSNWQIVEILKIFNGANNLEGTVARRNTDRSHPTRPNPPVNVTLTKGSVHITASRAFIEYLLHDQRSLLFRDWVKETYVSDETYFSSLNHSPQLSVPGSYLGVPETDTNKNLFITRFKNWGDGPFNWPCGGKRVRQVCVLGVRDLPLLYTRPELFANKFYIDYQPIALQCMENKLRDFVKSELENGMTNIDSRFYSSLDFVKNHLIINQTSITS